MNENFTVEFEDGVLAIRFSAAATGQDCRAAILKAAEFPDHSLRLWDMRSIQLDLSAEELRDLAEFGKSVLASPSRVVNLVADDLSFGLSRMYEVFRGDGHTEFRAFRSEQEGREWLLAGREQDS